MHRSRLSSEEDHKSARHYQSNTRLHGDSYKGRGRPHHKNRHYSGETERKRHLSADKHQGNRYFDNRRSNEGFHDSRYTENVNHDRNSHVESFKDRRVEDRYPENRHYDDRYSHDRNLNNGTYHNDRYHNDKRYHQRTHYSENYKPNDVPVHESRSLEVRFNKNFFLIFFKIALQFFHFQNIIFYKLIPCPFFNYIRY